MDIYNIRMISIIIDITRKFFGVPHSIAKSCQFQDILYPYCNFIEYNSIRVHCIQGIWA